MKASEPTLRNPHHRLSRLFLVGTPPQARADKDGKPEQGRVGTNAVLEALAETRIRFTGRRRRRLSAAARRRITEGMKQNWAAREKKVEA